MRFFGLNQRITGITKFLKHIQALIVAFTMMSAANGQCGSMTVMPIQVYQDTTICMNDSVPLSVVPLNYPSGIQVAWNNAGGINDTTSWNPIVSPTTTTTFVVKLWLPHYPPGCFSTDSVIVRVLPLPTIVANSSEDTICSGTSVTLWGVGGEIYEWDNGVLDGIPFILDSSNLFQVVGIDSNGCQNSDEIQVEVVDIQHPELGSVSVCHNSSYVLDAQIGAASYLWSTGETAPQIVVTEPGAYWVEIDPIHCPQFSDTAMVTLKDCNCYFYMPNAFSPNGDGINDMLSPVINCESRDLEITIYDRWGNQVYHANESSTGWSGDSYIPGIYNWVISFYSTHDNNFIHKRGHVMLIR